MRNLRFSIAGISVIALLSGCMNPEVGIYVSPAGSDDNPGTPEQPFASLEKARDEIRKLKQEGLKDNVSVNLLGGTYYLDKTFILGEDDSAPEGYGISYKAFNDEEVVLSSGVNIRDWKKPDEDVAGLPQAAAGKVWEAPLPEGLGRIYTLYDGEKRLPRAQTPGFIPTTPHMWEKPLVDFDNYTLEFPEGALRDWSNLEDAELIVIPCFPWSMNILPIASVNEKTKTARTTISATYPMCQMVRWMINSPEFASTCWVENVPEGLDSPGEWMVNTHTRKIYLWPEGENPGENIFAPALRELIRVEGKNDLQGSGDVPVTGIVFEGITFTQADRGVWNKEDIGIQHDWEMLDKDNAMLRFRGAEDCKVKACRFFNAGGNGIRMDLYAQNITVEKCLFHKLGQSAVMMLGYGPGTKDVNRNNTVKNNHIHHCGEIYWHSQMITAWQSGNNYIGHNYLHHIPRKAFCISGVRTGFLSEDRRNLRECGKSIRWEEIGKTSSWEELIPYLHSRGNLVEYNLVHHALELLGDGAAINVSGAGDDNIIRNNYVHHIMNGNSSAAIRTDNNQRKTLIENNVVHTCGPSGISLKGENSMRNNYVVNVCLHKNAGYIRGYAITEGISDIERNILYNPGKDRDFYVYHKIGEYPEEEYQKKIIDYNIYYNPHREMEDNPGLMALKSKGVEEHSKYTDPLFEDWENGDFTLMEASPAHAMGIKQIDLSDVGLSEDFPGKFRSEK